MSAGSASAAEVDRTPAAGLAQSRPRQLDALTGLRFVAALHVVAFHLTAGYRAHLPAAVRNVIDRGPESVSIFFILSGFVLAYNYRERAASAPRAFWLARFARIYPVYALALVVGLPMFLGHPPQYDDIQLDITRVPLGAALNTHAAAWVAWITLTQAWIPPLVLKWNYPGWSLSAEAFFYAVFPRISAIVGARSSARLWRVVGAAWAASLVMTACWWIARGFIPVNPIEMDWWGLVGMYNPLMRLPEFIIGIALGFRFMDGARLSRPGRATALSCAAILVAWCAPWPGALQYFAHALLIPAYAMLVLSLAYGQSWLARALAARAAVLLGQASYSLYLLHAPIIFAASQLLPRRAPGTHMLLAGVELAAVAVTAIVTSLLVYTCIEEPARRWIRGWGRQAARGLTAA